MGNEPKDLKKFRQENDEKAAHEADAIKRIMRQRFERVLQRMKDAGEVAQHVTVDDLLKDDEP